ncbi:MAG TPA: hypothetical protein VKL22_04820, partial [Actinomycetota bacterium]|nr:hypothetical protein [Actinomycetota bacterium]
AASPPADLARPVARTRHRAVLWAGFLAIALFLGALVLALLSARRLQGSIPGTDTIVSLAAIHPGFLVGTTGGLVASPDGRTWSAARIPRELVAVASDGATAYVLAGADLKATSDLRTFRGVAVGVTGTVIAAGPGGSVYVANGRSLSVAGPGGAGRRLPVTLPTSQILAMAVDPAEPGSLLAGGVPGLWRSDDAGATWTRLLGTPSQSVLFDPADPRRILLATPGGVLVSANGGLQWRFTEMRLDVHGLSQENGKFFAVTSDRIVYGSPDGVGGWRPFASR